MSGGASANTEPGSRSFAVDSAGPGISVVLATYNPDLDHIKDVLNSVATALRHVHPSELIIAENGSSRIGRELLSLVPDARLINLTEANLAKARCAGIAAAQYPLLMFVDDDTILDLAYAAEAQKMARQYPSIGVFGGAVRPRYDRVPHRWKKAALPFLAIRDLGRDFITLDGPDSCPADPIGAGMVVRREVAQAFVDFQREHEAQNLGRRGGALSSCEDSAICLLAHDLSMARAYAPSLVIDHIIPSWRIENRYLLALVYATGASAARLTVARKGVSALRRYSALHLGAQLARDILRHGPGGIFTWQWSLGYWREANRLARETG